MPSRSPTLLLALVLAACGDASSGDDTTAATTTTDATDGVPTTGDGTTTADTTDTTAADTTTDTTGEPMRMHIPETGFKTITANGVEFAYFESGSGPLVLLLHGFPDTAHTWDDLRPLLVDAGYRTVAPFMRGYTPSELIPGDDYGVGSQGADVVALIDALGADTAIVIGHDWGALASYAAANLAPDRVERLITLAIPHPLAYLKHPDAMAASPHFAALAKPDAAEAFAMNDFAGVDQLYATWSPTWDVPAGELEPIKNAYAFPGCLDATLGYYRAYASGVPDPIIFQQTSVRTLSFAGSADGAGDPTVFMDHQDGFTTPALLVTLDAGHFVHREAKAAVADAILAFLAAP
jgi:pimeloyl-ACP methyl ester carboxylesterase